MTFDPENHVVTLCADGMVREGLGEMDKAKSLFEQTWNEASADFEKFTAAHFVARHQPDINASYPSLYLNIARCREDLKAISLAESFYKLANEHLDFLPDDGYGKMIRSGILAGIERMNSL